MIRHPPNFPLFPYTPLFRSNRARFFQGRAGALDCAQPSVRRAHLLGSDFAAIASDPAMRARPDPEVILVPPIGEIVPALDRKSTRLNSSHMSISYAVFCLKK